MNPEVADAIPRLVERGILPAPTGALLLREARGERFSLHGELRLLLWAGVLSLTTGVGILVELNLERIGPLAIAVALGLGAAGALAWVFRVAPRFSWRQVPSPNLAYDYVLLLGLALLAADLAYVEVHFSPLGKSWPWHLLIVSLLYAAAAFRFDSRVVWSLALTTFAAWRGVAVTYLAPHIWARGGEVVRWNAFACGVAFCLLGWALKRADRKAHFEEVAVHLGWLAILGSLAAGLAEWEWGLVLLAVGAGLAAGAFWRRRFGLFAFGVIGGYAGLTRLLFAAHLGEILGCFWFSFSALALVVGLVIAQRRMREPL